MSTGGNTGGVKGKKIPVYMSRTEVAEYLGMAGVNSLSRIKLPDPDVVVGTHRGWSRATIDAWQATRPGPGWHGARDDPRRKRRANST